MAAVGMQAMRKVIGSLPRMMFLFMQVIITKIYTGK